MTGAQVDLPELVGLLARRGLTLATADSLTGGQLAADLVAVPGVSAVFRGGVVAYQNEVKAALLGVSERLLQERGSVDAGVAGQMALGACAATGARIGLATTGAAGPDPHDGKPVGTVFVAVAFDGVLEVAEHHFDGGRAQIRRLAEQSALALLAAVLAADTGSAASQDSLGKQAGTKQIDG